MDENKITLVLTLKVTFSRNGVSAEELTDNLEYLAQHAAGEGLMTGDSAAEVDSWEANVVEA